MKRSETELCIRLPRELADQINRLAQEYDVTVGSIVRQALETYLQKQTVRDPSDENAVDSNQKLAVLRSKFEIALRSAKSWSELQTSLRTNNLELAPKGGGLVLRAASDQQDVCKASELGHGYSSLIKRFGAGFPGHSHTWLADRILNDDDEPLIE